MRLKILLLTLLAIFGGAANAGETVEKDATLAVANQHMVLNFLSAVYYCENQHWPQSINTLQSFQEAEKITLPVKPDWTLLQSESFAFEVSDKVVVRSIQGAIPNAHMVTSTNSPPGCQDHNLEVKADMHISQ
jgi:hypothetical protein